MRTFFAVSAAVLILGLVGCAAQSTPNREANRGDNQNSGVVLSFTVLGTTRTPMGVTPSLAGTPQAAAASAATTQPSDGRDHKLFDTANIAGGMTFNVTINPSFSGTATATQGATQSPTATPTAQVTATANVPISAGQAGTGATSGSSGASATAPATSQTSPNGATQTNSGAAASSSK